MIFDRNELFKMADSNDEISEVIEKATKFIMKYEVPLCDYKIHHLGHYMDEPKV